MKCFCNDGSLPTGHTTDTCFRDLWLFDTLTDEQMQALKTIGVRRDFRAGEPVFVQGAPADELFLIKSGRIKLSKVQEDGTEMTLDFRKAGDVMGEDMLSGEGAYPLGGAAMEGTVTCGFDRQGFNALVMAHPDIGLSIIQSMSAKMTSMTGRLESMSENSLENRLYSVLSHVAREHGSRADNGVALDFPLTHEELGFLVGAHRVSITKAMKSLADSGKIIKHGKILTLPQTI